MLPENHIMKYCHVCGHQVKEDAEYCSNCGAKLDGYSRGTSSDTTQVIKIKDKNVSDRSRLVALLFVLFLGGLGIHRFYVGKIGTGILWLLTAGLFGIGVLIDLIMIVLGTFTDSEGKKVSDWGAND